MIKHPIKMIVSVCVCGGGRWKSEQWLSHFCENDALVAYRHPSLPAAWFR